MNKVFIIVISLLIISGLTGSYATSFYCYQNETDDTIKDRKRGEPIADFAIQEGSKVCVGELVHLINKSQNHIISYWSFGDGTHTYKNAPTHIYFIPQLYKIELLVKSKDNDSDNIIDYLLVSPLPSIMISPDKDTTFRQGQEFKVSVIGGFLSYEWVNSENITVSKNPTLTLTSEQTLTMEGSETYTVWVVDDNGCRNFKRINITIEKLVIPEGHKPEIIVENNIITPNGDGYNDYLTVKEIDVYLFPCVVKIYNVWGDLVYKNEDYDNTWNGSNDKVLDAGTYYYVMESKERKGAVGFVDIIR